LACQQLTHCSTFAVIPETLAKDRNLQKKIQRIQWIEPAHLDIHLPAFDKAPQFELAKIGERDSSSPLLLLFTCHFSLVSSLRAAFSRFFFFFVFGLMVTRAAKDKFLQGAKGQDGLHI
jgi:hypothetical protein